MSWKPEFKVDGVWYDNACRYPTEEAARAAGQAKFMAWTVPSDWRVVESSDPVNVE